MLQQVNAELVQRSSKISITLIVFVMLISLVCLSGWALESAELKTLFLGREMLVRSSISIGFILCGISLILLRFFNRHQTAVYLGLGLSGITFLAGLATLIESLAGMDLALDWHIYSPSETSAGITFPGPMAPNVAASFIFLSLALLTMRLDGPRSKWIWQICAMISLALTLTAFFGFLCGVTMLCTMFGCVKMSWTISIPLTLLSLALILANSQADSTRIFVTNSLGGRIARRFLTFALAIPLSLAIRCAGCSLKLYDEAFGWAVFALLVFGSLIGVVIWSARSLDVLDMARQEAIHKQSESELKREDTEKKLASEVAKQVVGQLGVASYPTERMKSVCLDCCSNYPPEMEKCPNDQSTLIKVTDNSIIGTVFADKYYILEELGVGGMAVVYKARHLYLEHQVFAVKVMSGNANPNTIKRFQQEAKTASKLSHANLLKIHDFGVTRKGQPYLLMDYIKGQSLRELLNQCKRLDLARFEQIFGQVLDGIAFAHNSGVVHRDLKPANIMLVDQADASELALIVDFGIAKEETVDGNLTKTGEVFGSPLYMSPEQWSGHKVDQRSDIYSLGCVMYECLVGDPPFRCDSLVDIVNCHLNNQLPEIPPALRVPENVQLAVKACLAKSCDDRPKNAERVKEMLLSSRKTSRSV